MPPIASEPGSSFSNTAATSRSGIREDQLPGEADGSQCHVRTWSGGASEHHAIDIIASSIYHADVRTTLTLDDDVAVRLEQEVRKRGDSFKAVVNDLLRAGLDARQTKRVKTRRFRTEGFDLGPSLVGSLDNVEEVLARAEGEEHQ